MSGRAIHMLFLVDAQYRSIQTIHMHNAFDDQTYATLQTKPRA